MSIIGKIEDLESILNSDKSSIFSRFVIVREDSVVAQGCVFTTEKISCYITNADTMITYPSLDMLYFDFSIKLGYKVVFLDKAIPEPQEEIKAN